MEGLSRKTRDLPWDQKSRHFMRHCLQCSLINHQESLCFQPSPSARKHSDLKFPIGASCSCCHDDHDHEPSIALSKDTSRKILHRIPSHAYDKRLAKHDRTHSISSFTKPRIAPACQDIFDQDIDNIKFIAVFRMSMPLLMAYINARE